MKKGKLKINSNDYEVIALAACLKDEDAVANTGISHSHFRTYAGYAACYATKPADWEKKYQGLNKSIKKMIQHFIDNGDCSPSYARKAIPWYKKGPVNKSPMKPRIMTNPVKEEAPVAVQQKLPLQNPGGSEKQALSSKNDVDPFNLMLKALDTISEVCRTIRQLNCK